MKQVIRLKFLKEIRNRNFRKLFLKNWALVFACIVIPLFLGVFAMQNYSDQSILREMDASIHRSASGMTATMRTLFTEAESILKKEITNTDMVDFFHAHGDMPHSFDDVSMMRSLLRQVKADCRESLYFSVDAYSPASDRIVSTVYGGQMYWALQDCDLRESFLEVYDEYPGSSLVATVRIARPQKTPTRVITVYQATLDAKDGGFVSISIDAEKLVAYITDTEERTQGIYLLVDRNGKVILDTSGQMNDSVLEQLAASEEDHPRTMEIEGQMMRIGMNELGLFGWNCVQMVPVSELEANSVLLRKLLIEIVLFGVLAACVISYFVTRRLFRPVRAILELLEDPSNRMLDVEERGEYSFLLVQVLELFQKNITLESDMAERVVALRNARAKALQGQLTPHFLNNVLQTINWIAIEETQKETSRTSEAVTLLADVIRMGKEQKTNFTTVEAEIEYTKKFVELEQLRYGPEMRCHFRVDEQALPMQIPCISIQPLVENAVLHGLQPAGGEGDIFVSIRKRGADGLRICVEDTGEGIRQEEIDRIFAMLKEEYIYLGEHLGVVNLFQRFRLLYGDACSFDIRSGHRGGACFEITFQSAEQGENETKSEISGTNR